MEGTVAAAGRTLYNDESVFLLLGVRMADPLSEVITLLQPADRLLEGDQRGGSLGCALLDVRPAELLHRARGPLPPRGRRAAGRRARGRRLRASAGDARLHPVRLRAGNARVSRPESDGHGGRESSPRHPRRTTRCAHARRLLRLRVARCRLARVPVAGAGASARRRAACGTRSTRQRGIERTETRPRPRAHTAGGSAARRGASVKARRRGASGAGARAGRRATCAAPYA